MSTDFWSNSSLSDGAKLDRKKYAAEVQYIILQFEKPKEWADLSNCLIRLFRTIHQSPNKEIPHKETICKRLAQCLNPQLPSGVHIRALHVYGAIFEKIGPEGLSADLALFSSGLFPFFTYSSLAVRPIFLNLIDQYYIPLGKKLLPCLTGLLICIIPGLDEEKSETYESVYKTLEKISDCVSERSYMRALWLILLKAGNIRLQTLCVIANKLAPGLPLLPKERVDVLLPQRHVLVIKALEATTEDDSVLVQREIITTLIKHFPLDSSILNCADKAILCRQCLKLLTRRDWSLNRRIYQWIFNSISEFNLTEESMDLEYFIKYTRGHLIKAIEEMLTTRGKTLEETLIPVKIIVTFITDTDLGGITDKLMPALCIPLLKYICKEHEEDEWSCNIIQETRLLFNPGLTPTNVVFGAFIDEYNHIAVSELSKTPNAWCELLELGNVYMDELWPPCGRDAALSGLLMLLNNSLQHLHSLDVSNDRSVIKNIVMYISTLFGRVEGILGKQGGDDQNNGDVLGAGAGAGCGGGDDDSVRVGTNIDLEDDEDDDGEDEDENEEDDDYVDDKLQWQRRGRGVGGRSDGGSSDHYYYNNNVDFANDVCLIDQEHQEKEFIQLQTIFNNNVRHHLNVFYTTALHHLSQKLDEICNSELTAFDMLNELAVRFTAIENILEIVPFTRLLRLQRGMRTVVGVDRVASSDVAVAGVDSSSTCTSARAAVGAVHTGNGDARFNDSSEACVGFMNKTFNEKLSLSLQGEGTQRIQQSTSPEAFDPKSYKLQVWIQAILKCTTNRNPKLFCRGIKTFIELLRLRNNSNLRRFIASGGGDHMRNIILQLWNGLVDEYSANHSEFVMLLLQLNSVVPESKDEAEAVIVHDLIQSEATLKISAMLKFGILWRYAHFHAPDDEVFPEAIGCILDNVEETDPKLRYYSRSFLAESINMLSHLLDPILRGLLSVGNVSPHSYSLYIFDVLRKFRHLSSIVGREGQVLIEMMQRHQAPASLLKLLQGKDVFARLSGMGVSLPSACVGESMHGGMFDDEAENINATSGHVDTTMAGNSQDVAENEMLIVFPTIKDPQAISYEDECIYDYVDLLVVLTLKYICLNVQVTELLKINGVDELTRYSETQRDKWNNRNLSIEENTMLFRCTAIDFMKLFLGSIHPTSRAKEVACLISRPLLCVLYQLQLEDDTIIQAQLLYLLKVVMDRCHLECAELSASTVTLVDMAVRFSRRWNLSGRRMTNTKSLDNALQITSPSGDLATGDAIQGLEPLYDDGDDDPMASDEEFWGLERHVSGDVFDMNAVASAEDSPIHEDGLPSQSSVSAKVEKRKVPKLPCMYILNVASIKRRYMGKLRRLSDDELFIRILELCGRNSARIDRTRLLQSYIDFSLYNLKFLNKNQSLVYASNFLVEFCNQLNIGREAIGIAGLSLYLRGVYFMLSHVASKAINLNPDVCNSVRFYSDQNAQQFEQNSLGDDNLPPVPSVRTRKKSIIYSSDDQLHIELWDIVSTCIQCLVWAKSVKGEAELTSRDRGSWASLTTMGASAEQWRQGDSPVHKVDFFNQGSSEAVRLDIKLSLRTITNEILHIFNLLYNRMPYYFCEGCLYLWDHAQHCKNTQELKMEMLKTLHSMSCFTRNRMVTLILDMLEPFAKSSRYKDTRGFFLLNCRVGDNTTFEFIYSVFSTPTINKEDSQGSYDILKRLVTFVLNYPRQPSVLLWVFNTICAHDRLYPSKDLQAISKSLKKLLGDVMLRVVYISVGLYMYRVCNWLPPKLYDLGLPLPMHVLLINNDYYCKMDTLQAKRASSSSGTSSSSTSSCYSYVDSASFDANDLDIPQLQQQETGHHKHIRSKRYSSTMDPLECSCKNALAQLIIFNYDITQLNRRTAIINIFFQALVSNMSSYILPLLQLRIDAPKKSRYLILLLLRNLPFALYDGSLLYIKKSIVEAIHNPDFFKMDRRSLKCFISLFRRIAQDECRGTADRLIKLDQYTQPPHTSVFQSRSINIQSRIRYLKRLAFVLYACDNDTFAQHITTILERLTINYRTYDDDQLKANTLLVMRVLLVRMSQRHLTALWPVLLSELIKIFDSERREIKADAAYDPNIDASSGSNSLNMNGVAAAVDGAGAATGAGRDGGNDSDNKSTQLSANTGVSSNAAGVVAGGNLTLVAGAVSIIDVACALRLNEFLIYQWLFVNDLSQGDEAAVGVPMDFKPFLTDIERLYPGQSLRRLIVDGNSIGEERPVDDAGGSCLPTVLPNVDQYKQTSQLIDEAIENDLLEFPSSEIDKEPEIPLHQIYKVYRKAL